MCVFQEDSLLVTVTYRNVPGGNDVLPSFADGVAGLLWAYRFGFLSDFREATGPLSILSSQVLSQKWMELARGRDVGRRTAVVTQAAGVLGQVEAFRELYPYRVIAVFEDVDEARDWILNAGDGGGSDVQFV